MGFFSGFFKSSIGKFVGKAVGATAGFVLSGGNPLGAAAGAALVGAAEGETKPLQIAGNAAGGYFGANAVTGVASAASAASAAGSAAGGVGPVASGFGAQATVFGNALLSQAEASPLGTIASTASHFLGSKTATNTASLLSGVGGVVGAYSSMQAGKAAEQGGIPSPNAPQNDPNAVAAAATAADDQARKRKGSAANILTSPLGLAGSSASAAQQLLG